MSAFSVDLATLAPGRHRVELACDAADLGLPRPEWRGEVRGDFEVEKSGGQVRVRGLLDTVASLECVRCLRVFELGLKPMLEVFAEQGRTGHRLEEEALERDDYMQFHDGRTLDLSDAARETLLLEVPLAPRCREDCRGLCAVCGADRNEEACEHG
jgi:uncharacterized protein